MASVRVYIRGEGVQEENKYSKILPLPNGRKMPVNESPEGYYVQLHVHAGHLSLPDEVKKQMTCSTMLEETSSGKRIAPPSMGSSSLRSRRRRFCVLHRHPRSAVVCAR